MARKGENIFKRKDGRWEARYIKGYDINNKIIYGYVYGKNYSTAKNKRNKIMLSLKENKNILTKDTFMYLSRNWINQKLFSVKESTYSRYLDIINNHLNPFFGSLKLNKINNQKVLDFITLKTKSGLSNKTIRDILTVLKQITTYGQINITVKAPKIIPKKIKTLGLEDQKKLEKYIKNHFDNEELGIFIALYMGLRIGEVCGLKWKDIDIKNQTIYVNRTVSRVKNLEKNAKNKTKIVINEPKTVNSKRTIHIPSTILPFFEITKKKSYSDENFVLTNTNKLLEPRSYYNKYKRILNKLKIGGFNFHALRHTFATRCIELGFDPKTLMEILGHSDIKITLAFYVHPTEKLKEKNMEKLSLLKI